MLDSPVLDVTIGLLFVYLLLSLICSALHEMAEAWMKQRATDLERGLRELLQDPTGKGLVQQVYCHPLVYGLFKGNYDPNRVSGGDGYPRGSNLPSYIPARNFALALMDVILPAAKASPSGAAGATTGPSPVRQSAQQGSPTEAPMKPLAALRTAIEDMSSGSAIQPALYTLVDAAGEDVSRARENIENWYNSAMDRVSGCYKRRTQMILLALGAVLAVVMNADTIGIATSLSRDKNMRDSLVAEAQKYVAGQTNKAEANAESRLRENARTITQFGLPLGWDTSNALAVPNTVDAWILKIVGWLITAVAVSLGAPFWFDLLNKVMIVRSTVKPHEKSPEESSRG